ncbi:MAG TPA: cytochrome c oxidase assembly protein [Solirubrobacterales bacterium]|nr:cytochrome c oxidase assembly protein [Solirubrobacterales bacterium]
MATREAGSEAGEVTDLLPIAATALVAALYARRTRSLARRGRPMPAWRQACFYLGLAALLAALISPLDRLAETRIFYAHMIQHLTIGELAPLLLLLGLSGAVLRPLLALPPAGRLRFLLLPLVALPLWALNLYLWHLPALYEAALASEPVHWLEHASFFTAGLLMWGALLEPLPGPAWFGSGAKATYVLAVRALGCAILGNVLIWSGTAFYPAYAPGERIWGISPLADQQIGGAIMFIWGALITIVVFSWLFLRWLREAELRQSLLDAGGEERVAVRAARYRRRPPARRAPAPPPPPPSP